MRRKQPDPGAAAVEFALVAPVLFLLLFGIIEYGAWFADEISIRQAAAAGARLAANWSPDDSATSGKATSEATADKATSDKATSDDSTSDSDAALNDDAALNGGASSNDGATPPWGTVPAPGCTAWDAGPGGALPSPEIRALGCGIQASAQPLTGRVYVKIRIIPADQVGAASPRSAAGPDSWAIPNAVQICLLQVHTSLTGIIPLPAEVITARVVMPLGGTSTSGLTLVEGGQALPDGLSWNDSCP